MKTVLWLLISETAKVQNMKSYYNLVAAEICMQDFLLWLVLFLSVDSLWREIEQQSLKMI